MYQQNTSNLNKQNSFTQSENYTAIHDPRFYPHNPKMDTSNLEIKSIKPDIYQDDIQFKRYTLFRNYEQTLQTQKLRPKSI